MSTADEKGKNGEDRKYADRNLFRDVIGRFASGVTVITARHEDTDYGITASAVASLTLDPPMLLACVNKQTGTENAISHSGAFAVNILDEDQGEMAMRFARPDSTKFRGVGVSYGELGEPLLDGVLAHLECRVAEQVTGGTHSVFLAEVQKAEAREGTPLTYFRGKFGRFQAAEDEAIYGQLRQQLLARELPLEQPLDPEGLAHGLDAPLQSVYGALARLGSEGLVSREDNDYLVNPIDADTLAEAMDARCAIEIGAAERAVGNVSHEDLARLREKAEATLPHVQDGRFVDFDAYMETNREFHEFVISLAGNDMLLSTYRQLGATTAMLRSLHGSYRASDSMTRDHVRLVEAFEAEDLEAAKRVIYDHAENAKEIGRRAIEGAGGRI
jgi:flavin reductase (DIM6/NTAB) family NADH-FMN oxidoreductase RutF